MEQLFPSPVEDVDTAKLFANDARPAKEPLPWVVSNMITSIDGAIEIDGVSGGLGGPADKVVFGAIRAIADVILVGSGTVIAENYRRPQIPPEMQAVRKARGQTSLPRIAIVSGSLSIEVDHRVFDPQARPIVVTHAGAPPDRKRALEEVADVIVAGERSVDLRAALATLCSSGTNTVLLEGGPSLNGAMASAGLIDEMCVSLAPHLAGGNASRMLVGTHSAAPGDMLLDRVLHQDGFLFLRYLRQT